MSWALSLHNGIEKWDFLQKPTEQLADYLKQHPDLYKTALLVNHVFRAASMAAFSLMLPFSAPLNAAICFAGSLFYRLTVETHCAYKFALPAFAGSLAFPLAQPVIVDLIRGVAFASFSALAIALTTVLPLAAYFTYIALTVSYEVEKRCKKV